MSGSAAFPDSEASAHDEVASPCVGVCRLLPSRICAGCGRSLDEIAGWAEASPASRRAIRIAAARRLARMKADGASREW